VRSEACIPMFGHKVNSQNFTQSSILQKQTFGDI
jgi:hypothetical protein